MSATVTYKGATLTTATNQTRVLETEGTYLEDDITITDATTVPTGTKNISITSNGTTTEDVTNYASASITANVPNSYSAGDEGKVVSSGALVAQTAHADVTPTTSDQTIDTTTNNSLKVKGDANLVAGNIKKDVEIFGTTGSYEGGGGGISVDDIATNTEPSGAITLGSGVTTIAAGAFYRNTKITSITGANVTEIKVEAFRLASNLTSATFNSLTKTNGATFKGTKLSSASFASLATVGSEEFQDCLQLTSVSLPAVTTIGDYFFNNCQTLTSVNVPLLTKIPSNSFQQLYALQTLDLPKVTQINQNAFYNARVIQTLILRHTSVVALDNVNAFTNTPLRGYNGQTATVYVPSSLVATYKTATNWKTMYDAGSCDFVAIEGSQYE